MAYSAMAITTAVLCTAALHMSVTVAMSPCAYVRSAVDWVPDPNDCEAFYICAFGQAIPLRCGNNLVWIPDKRVCDVKGSDLDTCTKKLLPRPKALTGVELEKPKTCQPGMTEKLPHPKHCARYMDCASRGVIRGMTEEQERECTFPKLFNSETGECDHYDNVTCGEKEIPKDACDYEMNKCYRAHCIPCYVRYASCKGMADGKQIWKGKEHTPFFAECKNERVMKQGRCKKGQMFNADLKSCVDATSGLDS